MRNENLTIATAWIDAFAAHLREQERSAATIQKYVHDVQHLVAFLAGREISKGLLLEWKRRCSTPTPRPASIPCWLPSIAFYPSAARASCGCGS